MPDPVVHFEIIGADPTALQDYYAELFGWTYALGDASAEEVSAPGKYGFAEAGINGGVAGGDGYEPRVLFYVGVDNVEKALQKAESLGGKRVMGPKGNPGVLVVGRFTDPEGNLIGVAGSS